jgi:phage-related protein
MNPKYRLTSLLGMVSFLFVGAMFLSPVFAVQLGDKDTTRQELLNLDRFLDSHPAIEQDLKKTPALVNDSAYLSAHPELKEFLNTHPGVREEIRENPRGFMNREQRFDSPGRDITRQELQNFDGFLDKHPNIEQDLRKNPKLLNNSTYISAHPDLKEFLDTHPGVRAEASENPRIFMNREAHFENSGRDIPVEEARSLDDFLDKHPAIERELRRDPSLANKARYIAKHPELKTYLDQHPLIRQQLAENPRGVIRAENRIDKIENQESKAERREERIERVETRRPGR